MSLRSFRGGLWLLSVLNMAFLRNPVGPNSVGAVLGLTFLRLAFGPL